MPRSARSSAFIESAKQQMSKTNNANLMRMLLAVILPLGYGLSTADTASIVGRSARWVSTARNEYLRNIYKPERVGKQIRNHSYMTIAEEKEFLAPFIERAKKGEFFDVKTINQALQERLGRTIALSTTYNLLNRHNWRQFIPDRRRTRSFALTEEEDI